MQKDWSSPELQLFTDLISDLIKKNENPACLSSSKQIASAYGL